MKIQTSPHIILEAETGCYLYNGEFVGKKVILPSEEHKQYWHEITQAEYLALMEAANEESTATEEDYQAALREMGVKV